MRILIISYFFPPGNSIADLRAGKFAKFFRRFGADVQVLTAEADPRKRPLTPLEIPGEMICRTPIFRFSRKARPSAIVPGQPPHPATREHPSLLTRFGRRIKHGLHFNNVRMPDDLIGWYPYAIKHGRKLLSEMNFDVILSSSGPVTSHLVAHRLQKETGIPWVADYRDPWSQNHLTRIPQPWHALDEALEKRTLANASLITTVSGLWGQELQELHAKPVEIISNGFDPDDYNVMPAPELPGGVFRLSYFGSLYDKRDPAPLFKAIIELARRSIIAPETFRVVFYCQDHDFARRRAVEYGVSNFVDFQAAVTYYESLSHQKSSTALLLVEETSDAAAGVLTGKIYEYAGSNRPILAVGPRPGSLDQLLQKTNAGALAANSDEIAGILERWIREFECNGFLRFAGFPEVIAHYSRERQARMLYDIIARL